jgi:hypothetical protein
MMNKKNKYFAAIAAFAGLFFFWWLLYSFFSYQEPVAKPAKEPNSFFNSSNNKEIYFTGAEELVDWKTVSTELQLSSEVPEGFLSALKKKYISVIEGKEGFYYLLEFSAFIKALAFYLRNSIGGADWNKEDTAFVNKGCFFASGGQFVGIAFAWIKPEPRGFLLHKQTMLNLGKNISRFPVSKNFKKVEFRKFKWESIELENSLWLDFTADFGLFLLDTELFADRVSPLITERNFQSGSYSALRGHSLQSSNVIYLRRHPEFVTCITGFDFSLNLTQKIYLRRFL